MWAKAAAFENAVDVAVPDGLILFVQQRARLVLVAKLSAT